MRLFPGIFTALIVQAVLAALVPAALLAWILYASQSQQIASQDRERLSSFAATAAEAARAGRPLDQLVPELDRRDAPLSGRVQIVTPQGTPIAGPSAMDAPRAERPVQVDGRSVAIVRIVRDPTLTDDDRRTLALQYLGIALVALLVFASLLASAFVFARRWTRPQLELYRLSRDVVHGEHDVVFDEEGTLPSETLATMRNLRRLASQFSRLETARRTWLVAIADELRQPTQNMGEHFIQLCTLEPPLDSALLGAIEADTHRLIHMAEDLSAVALADLGRLPVAFTPLDPRTLLHDAVQVHRHRAESQGVDLGTGPLPQDAIEVQWDGERIGQLFGALIDNSLRYTPPNGRILLGLEHARDAWRLVVDDSAPGVDVTLARQLFEPFYRSADRIGESAASGLGLATARAIVEAHHGRIDASHSPIGGLRVAIVLPASPPTA